MLKLFLLEDHLTHPEVQARLATARVYFRPGIFISLRRFSESEKDRRLRTFIKDTSLPCGYRREPGEGVLIMSGSIHARSKVMLGVDVFGVPVYYEWILCNQLARETYGAQVIATLNAHAFSLHKKKVGLKAFEVTQAFLDVLHIKEDRLAINVPWDYGTHLVKKGDYLTDLGGSIAHALFPTYTEVVQGCLSLFNAPQVYVFENERH